MDSTEARTSLAAGDSGGPVYDAFLSYSHDTDSVVAPRLQAGVQRFAKPWWRRQALRVFRDESSLSANPHLWSSIVEAMDDSAWMVLLLSPEAASSQWVNREVGHWLESKPANRIIPVLTAGDFTWFDEDFISDAAPPALEGAFGEEPRWVDLRFAHTDEQLDLRNARFRDAVADVASAIRGIPKDELESEEIRQHRRTVRTAWAAGIVLVLFAMFAAAAALFALDRSNDAQEQQAIAEAAAAAEAEARGEAEEQAQIARARELAAASLLNLDVDPERSILLALQAVDTANAVDGSVVTEPATALHHALATSRVVLRIEGGWFGEYSADGSLFAAGLTNDSGVEDTVIWDADTGERIRMLPSPDGRIAVQATFSPDGRSLAVGYDDAKVGELGPLVAVWDVSTGEVIMTFDDPDLNQAWVVSFSADGELVAAETTGETASPVMVWEVASGTERYRIDYGEGGWAHGPSFSPDGRLLAVAGSAGVMLYDATTGEEFTSLEAPTDWTPGITAFDPTGQHLAALSQFPPVVVVWDIDSAEIKSSWELEQGPAGLEWHPAGQLLAIGGNDGTPRLYDAATGEEVLSLLGHTSIVWSLAFNPSGDRLAGAGLFGDTLFWEVRPAVSREIAAVATPYPELMQVAYSADGDSILVVSDEEGTRATFARIDPDSGEVLETIPDQFDSWPVQPLAFPEAGLVASLNSAGSAALHDAQTFEPIISVPEGYYAEELSRDGTRVVLYPIGGEGNGVVAVVGSWETLATLEGSEGGYTFFSPDGDLLMTGLQLIDVSTGSVVATFPHDGDFMWRFSPDGTTSAVHTPNGGLKLLDVAALKAGTAKEQAIIWEITAHNGPIFWSHFSPDGSLIATMAGDTQLRVWETRRGEKVADFGTMGGSFPAFGFHPDGKHLIGEDTGGTIQVLTLDGDELVDIARSQVTRGFTEQECTTYRIDPCPTLQDVRSGSA